MKKTKEEKLQMFFDFQEYPDKYSDEQVNELLADEEVRTFVKEASRIKQAMMKQNLKHVDVDEAWQQFTKEHLISKRKWMNIAATAIGVVFISGIAFASAVQLGIISFPNTTPTEKHTTETIVSKEHIEIVPDVKKDSIDMKPVIFEDAELKEVLTQFAAFYQVKVIYNNEEVVKARLYFTWDKNKPLNDCIEVLNGFDRFNLSYSNNTITVE